MIRMVRGTYGFPSNGKTVAMTPKSGPFELTDAREAELVAAGVAVKVEKPKKEPKKRSRKAADKAAVQEAEVSSASAEE